MNRRGLVISSIVLALCMVATEVAFAAGAFVDGNCDYISGRGGWFLQ
jgi:hypothetical protein